MMHLKEVAHTVPPRVCVGAPDELCVISFSTLVTFPACPSLLLRLPQQLTGSEVQRITEAAILQQRLVTE